MRVVIMLLSPLLAGSWSIGTAAGPRVSGHTAAVDEHCAALLLFGGLTGSAGSPTTNELWMFDAKDEWRQVESNGGPGPRMYAASAIRDDHFYVFGGWDPEAPGSGGAFKDDVWKLDLNTLEWTQLEPMPCGAASRHAACLAGDLVVVHTYKGTLVMQGQTLRLQPTTGLAPDGLSMCALSPLGDDQVVLFGGSTKEQGMSSDVYVLDTQSWKWCKLSCPSSGPSPTPRASSCMAAVALDACVVFGGAGLGGSGYAGGAGLMASNDTWRLTVDGDQGTWEQLEVAEAPTARVAASMNLLPDGRGLLVQGGWEPTTKQTFALPCRLDLETARG